MIDQLLVSLVAGALSGGLVQAFRVHIDARAKRVEHRTQVFFDVREYWRTKSTVRDDGESLSKTYGDLAPKVEAAWPGSGLGLTLLALADAVLLQGDTGTRKPELESEITRTAECVDEVIRALDGESLKIWLSMETISCLVLWRRRRALLSRLGAKRQRLPRTIPLPVWLEPEALSDNGGS